MCVNGHVQIPWLQCPKPYPWIPGSVVSHLVPLCLYRIYYTAMDIIILGQALSMHVVLLKT
jgi:hypothetical protein